MGVVYQNNIQNSIYAITNSAGQLIESYSYDIYGKRTVYNGLGEVINNSKLSIQNYYGFTGRRYDAETGLYYFRARYYNAELGRFISRDPLTFVDGMNMYAGYFSLYGLTDPMGLDLSQDENEMQRQRDLFKKIMEEAAKNAEKDNDPTPATSNGLDDPNPEESPEKNQEKSLLEKVNDLLKKKAIEKAPIKSPDDFADSMQQVDNTNGGAGEYTDAVQNSIDQGEESINPISKWINQKMGGVINILGGDSK